MAYLTQFATNTVSNTNLVAATLVATITNNTRIRKLWVNIYLDQCKGGGDYIAHITIQRAGAGSNYESIKTTKTAGAGITSLYFGSIAVTLNATDVMKVYLIGLATDNDTTADVIVDVNEEWQDTDTSGRVLLQPAQAGVTIPTVTTLTNAPPNSAGVTTILADYARRTGDYSTVAAVAALQANVTTILTDYARRTGDYPTAAEIWAYVTRTLTQSGATVVAAVVGTSLNVVKYLTFTGTLTGLTIPATWTKVYLTVKSITDSLDTAAQLQIVESNPGIAADGLKYIIGTTTALALLAVTDAQMVVNQGAGTIAITITDEATAKLTSGGYSYDVKCLLADGSSQLLSSSAQFTISDAETRAIV
jgi:hypothetical protein